MCPDLLRSRKARAEEPLDAHVPDAIVNSEGGIDPEHEALLGDVVLRADRAAVQAGANNEVRGAVAVAKTFSGRARAAQPALVDGAVGAVWAPGGRRVSYSRLK